MKYEIIEKYCYLLETILLLGWHKPSNIFMLFYFKIWKKNSFKSKIKIAFPFCKIFKYFVYIYKHETAGHKLFICSASVLQGVGLFWDQGSMWCGSVTPLYLYTYTHWCPEACTQRSRCKVQRLTEWSFTPIHHLVQWFTEGRVDPSGLIKIVIFC